MEQPVSLLYLIQLDAAVGTKALDPVHQQYLDILEKTNQQLSLWWNPYGVMVAVLGVLFGLATILLTGWIFIQSRDFQARIRKAEKDREDLLNSFIANCKAEVDGIVNQMQTEVVNIKKLVELSTGENKAVMEELVSQYEKKLSTYEQQGTSFASPLLNTVLEDALKNRLTETQAMRCHKCGAVVPLLNFKISAGSTKLSGSCPRCFAPNERPL